MMSKREHIDAEKHIDAVLDDLESRGALQCGNRMDIEALINPVNESQVLYETTDEEICQAVQNC